MKKEELKIGVIVGTTNSNECIKVQLPMTDEKLMKELKKVPATQKNDYEIVYCDCDDLYINKETDIVELNRQAQKLKELRVTMDEVRAVQEAFDCWGECNSLDDVIKIITSKDYEFYDEEDFEEFKEIYQDEILDHLDIFNIMEHLADNMDSVDFLDRFTPEEQLSVFYENDLTDALNSVYASYSANTGIIVDKRL